MSKTVNINNDWKFIKEGKESLVNLPHTWNNLDGQNGENGYYQGKCCYIKTIPNAQSKCFLEINGANSVCEVFINDTLVGSHKGGYSMFRLRIDQYLVHKNNELKIFVDNTVVSSVYPTSADFTFYGGLYRDVNLIYTHEKHFAVDDNSRTGIHAVPKKLGDSWRLEIKADVVGADGDTVCVYSLKDDKGVTVATKTQPSTTPDAFLEVLSPHLWDGIDDPYLYTLECDLVCDANVIEQKIINVGFREIAFDSEKGCFLNGRHIKLKGVCRHQDREDMGNAITVKEHSEDINIILECGANALRLAHYQQSEDFYTLCDKVGLLVWAEVPVITIFSKARQQNAEDQLTSLINQNINHPCIFCWGIQNEITISGEKNKHLQSCLERLNEIAHTLDPSRLTTCAQVSMTTMESPLNKITDLVGYNHYFGWYMQTCSGLDKWLNKFHNVQPDVKLCLSEYGAEAILGYFSENPVQGDYSEGYQAIYHEHYINSINSRDWIWGSFVWNMFDFGSASRNEGGVRGRNNKGLVTFDRKTKKDAFYIYKATWSEQKFVHITQKRYPCRVQGTTTVKVYSNLDSVTLTAGDYSKTITADRVFVFENVPIKLGDNLITASSGHYCDSFTAQGVEELPKSYAIGEGVPTLVRNWFGTDQNSEPDPKRLSINDKIGTLLDNKEALNMLKLAMGSHLGKWYIKLLRPFKVKTLLKIAGVNKETTDLINGFLQTINR